MFGRRESFVVAAAVLVAGLAAVTSPATAVTATPLSSAATANLGDGASSWFQGPRAIVTNDGCEVAAGSVGGAATNGDVNVSTWTLGAQERLTTTLDQTLLHDDHNAPGLVQLANGELFAAWSGHAQDRRVRAAVRSTTGRWTRLPGFTTFGRTTYNNVFQRSDGTLLDFVRHPDATSTAFNPDLYTSPDNGRTWTALGQLLRFTGSPRNQRPYVRYAQLGDRIFFITTQGHPRELAAVGIDAAIYAGYLDGTTIFRSDGTAVGTVGAGVEVTALSQVYFPPPGRGAWTSDISFATDGAPVATFSVRDRNVAWNAPTAIRYLQARFVDGAWGGHDVAPGGRAIYADEDDYSGNVATDPVDPDHVVISSTVDPTTGVSRAQYDLFDGHSTDGGATWSWVRLTATAADELRPDLTNAADGVQALVWFAGRYETYMRYTTTVRARILDARSPADRAARCGNPRDAGSPLIPGDFDGDTRTDVLSYRPGSRDHRISWGSGRPDALVAGLAVTVGGAYRPVAGDFDGDGRSDVFWYAPGPAADSIGWGSPDRRFTSGPRPVVNGHYRPVTGDFDGDGRDDIYWYAPGTAADSIWWGNRNRGFSSTPRSVNGTYDPVVGDFDGNGRDDIYWYAPGAGADSIWWGNRNRGFSSTPRSVNGTYRPVVGDFNGNGHDDIYWYAPGTAADSIWWGDANQRFVAAPATRGSSYRPIAGDFDGDGPDDIHWHAPGAATDVLEWGSPAGTFISSSGPWR